MTYREKLKELRAQKALFARSKENTNLKKKKERNLIGNNKEILTSDFISRESAQTQKLLKEAEIEQVRQISLEQSEYNRESLDWPIIYSNSKEQQLTEKEDQALKPFYKEEIKSSSRGDEENIRIENISDKISESKKSKICNSEKEKNNFERKKQLGLVDQMTPDELLKFQALINQALEEKEAQENQKKIESLKFNYEEQNPKFQEELDYLEQISQDLLYSIPANQKNFDLPIKGSIPYEADFFEIVEDIDQASQYQRDSDLPLDYTRSANQFK